MQKINFFCKSVLHENNSYGNRRTDDNCVKNVSSKNKRRKANANNEYAPRKAITWAPLLIGQVAFGKPNNRCLMMHRKELEAREVAKLEETENIGMRALVTMVKEAEHGELATKNDKELNDDEKRELKFFSPYFLTAEEW